MVAAQVVSFVAAAAEDGKVVVAVAGLKGEPTLTKTFQEDVDCGDVREFKPVVAAARDAPVGVSLEKARAMNLLQVGPPSPEQATTIGGRGRALGVITPVLVAHDEKVFQCGFIIIRGATETARLKAAL